MLVGRLIVRYRALKPLECFRPKFHAIQVAAQALKCLH